MSKMFRKIGAVALAGSFVFALAACGDGNDEPAADDASAESPMTEAPATDPTVVAHDFEFETPDTWAAGEQTIAFENEGEEPHEMVLIALDEGKTFEDVMAVIEEDPNAKPPSWVTIIGGNGAGPGQTAKKPTTADLEAGTYVLACFVTSKANDDQPHAALGMVKEITVA
ncbi:MAG: hypothetical protein WEA10_00620 [Actinomycetota bacterium]